MNTQELAITLLSSLLSGIIGVFISSSYYRKQENRRIKLDLLMKIVGYRYCLTDKMINSDNKDFFVSLNEVVIVFNENDNVIAIIKKLYEELNLPNRLLDNIISLIKEMAKSVGMSMDMLNDSFLEHPFVPNNN